MNISSLAKEISIKKEEIKWPQNLDQFTPLMKQFLEVKYKYDLDVLLFFRVGDFYETFFDDARIVSRELEITLTGRAEASYPDGKISMAGVPAKAVTNYISKLLDKGFKVAICEQMEDPALAKGIVKREVTKLLTPGTILETEWLPQTKNNYLASIVKDQRKELYGFAYSDISCGEFCFTVLNYEQLISELNRTMPSEVLVPLVIEKKENQILKEKALNIDTYIKENWFCTGLDSDYFKEEFANKRLKEELKISSLNSLCESELLLGQIAAASILAYVDNTQLHEKPIFEKIKPYYISSFLSLDKTTRKNLELTETAKDKSYNGSLLWAIDYTKTQMGKRRLRGWIEQPLLDINLINVRLSCIEELIKNKFVFYDLSNSLEKIFDLERISSRLSASAVNAKELRVILSFIPEARAIVAATLIFFGNSLTAVSTSPSKTVVSDLISSSLIAFPSTRELLDKPDGGLRVVNVILEIPTRLAALIASIPAMAPEGIRIVQLFFRARRNNSL